MTGSKALRATTIIPDALYVDRDADRQLEAVVEEMGRPGYILVARQMGKTNLLLRMKRKRERKGDLALYMDLSTRFDTARNLFRSIIDNLVETISNKEVLHQIARDRASSDVDANAEYDRHLRLFLKCDIHERVIIILDEIDSLVGHTYSDRILSQIRSMYFARANYPIYEKLTYVLSGVAEPTDLIKDRNVSPFNIGEKIYLNDFSIAETQLLITKSHLNFPRDVVEAVFEWVSGNPRMTWDVCASLEDLQRAGELISVKSVQSVINKLYLTRFDRPPIDHIRALAESDREVRDALISLLQGQGAMLEDRARSKLYLAGITTASANDSPAIKNKVIEFALSESWLLQVESGKKGLLEAASKRFLQNEYSEAISLFNQFIELDGGSGGLSDINLMDLGLSYYRLSQLAEAEKIFVAAIAKTKSREIRSMMRFHLAIARLLLGSPAEAIPILEEVASAPGPYQLQAQQQIASAYSVISISDNANKIIDISKELLMQLDNETDLSEDDVAELRIASHYNLARVYRVTNRKDYARSELRAARTAALDVHLPGLSFMLVEEGFDADERREMFLAAARVVIRSRPAYTASPASFAFKKSDMAALLSVALEFKDDELFAELLDVATGGEESERFTKLIELGLAQGSTIHAPGHSNLLRHALVDISVGRDSSPKLRLEAARGWLLLTKGAPQDEAFDIFFSIVSGGDVNEHLIDDDFALLVTKLSSLARDLDYVKAYAIINFARDHHGLFQSNTKIFFALVLFHEMNLESALFNEERARRTAREIQNLLSPASLRNDSLAAAFFSTVVQLRDAAQATLRLSSPGRIPKKVGRNQIVVVRDKATGAHLTEKFKYVADRIARGELEFVDVES